MQASWICGWSWTPENQQTSPFITYHQKPSFDHLRDLNHNNMPDKAVRKNIQAWEVKGQISLLPVQGKGKGTRDFVSVTASRLCEQKKNRQTRGITWNSFSCARRSRAGSKWPTTCSRWSLGQGFPRITREKPAATGVDGHIQNLPSPFGERHSWYCGEYPGETETMWTKILHDRRQRPPKSHSRLRS